MNNPITRLGAFIKGMIHTGGLITPGTPLSEVGRSSDGTRFIPTDGSGHTMTIGGGGKALKPGDAWKNSTVSIGLDWIISNFPQADLVVQQRVEKDWDRVEFHDMIALLDDPAPGFGAYDFHTLWGGALLSCYSDGNGYWRKIRDQAGRVRELWWIPHYLIFPYRVEPGSAQYKYLLRAQIPGRAEPYVEIIEPRDIVHFKHGPPDTDNDLKACAPLRHQLNHVCSDNEVGAYTAAILHNRGMPGIVAVWKGLGRLTQPVADEARNVLDRLFGGSNRGSSAVLDAPFDLQNPAFSPDKLALQVISRIPEARLCAAIGVAPMLLGLNVGDEQKSYANQNQAERQTWRRMRSVQGRMAEALYRQLLPDFEPDVKPYRVAWDYTNVEALQEDRDATARRSVLLFRGDLATRGEARKMVGLPETKDGTDDLFSSQLKAPKAAATPVEGEEPEDAPAKAIDAQAVRVMTMIEAELEAKHSRGDGRIALPGPPEGGGALAIVGGGGGKPARLARWQADRQGGPEGVPGAPGVGPEVAVPAEKAAGGNPEPGSLRGGDGGGPGVDDLAVPRGVGGSDAPAAGG